MENLYSLGFLAASTGSITEENVFAARKCNCYTEMLIFSVMIITEDMQEAFITEHCPL